MFLVAPITIATWRKAIRCDHLGAVPARAGTALYLACRSTEPPRQRRALLALVLDGIGLPQGSDLREPINRALLSLIEAEAWTDAVERDLGRP